MHALVKRWSNAGAAAPHILDQAKAHASTVPAGNPTL
jgi:anti-sigma factor RsiW